MQDSTPSGDSRAMLYTVARLHYRAELPQVEIARQLGVSTATISRLLQRARAEGIVKIEVRDPVAPDMLGARISERLGLRRVAVVDAVATDALGLLAAPLGDLLRAEGFGGDSLMALGWGRAIRAAVTAGLPPMPGITIVPATGGMQQQAPHFQINEFTRLAAEQMGGSPHFLHAPYLPSASARPAFLSDPAIRDTVALWDRIDVAVLGVGLPHRLNPPGASVATPTERSLTDTRGDVIRHYFDIEGNIIHWEGEDRMIAMSAAQLRAVPVSIGVAADPAKAASILGALRSGMINSLVTDARTAEAILSLLG